MQRQSKEYTILNSVTPTAITSSTDATPIVVTATSHGLANGDLVMIFGHTTNTAANGIFKVANKAANTFELTNRYTEADIAGSGAGAGANGLACAAPKIALVSDFKNAVINVITTGTSTLTLKVAGSLGKLSADSTDGHGDTPNFGATQNDTNPYTYVQCVDLQGGASVNGDTGLVLAGTDINKTLEVNVNALKYLTLIPTAWTQGSITVKLLLTNDQ